ncbi:MAG: nitrite reductase small subunit NirD [Acidobacteriaceae bacterium]
MNPTVQWVCVTRQDGIPLREGRAVRLGNIEVAIFNLGDRVAAVENRCPHRNGPLSEGMLSGGSVVCPLHSWKVCLDTGAVAKPTETAACVATYKTRLENGLVYVSIPIWSGEISAAAEALEIETTVLPAATVELQLEL